MVHEWYSILKVGGEVVEIPAIPAILGGVVLLGAAIQATRLWLWPAMKDVAKIARAIKTFAEAQPTLMAIAAEFRPNDGSSLVDRIGRIEMKIDDVLHGQVQITEELSIIEIDNMGEMQ